MDCHAGEFLALACWVHRGNTGGWQPPPPTVPPVGHAGAMTVPTWIVQSHNTMQEGSGAEATAFGGGGVKGGVLKGVHHLHVQP